MTPTETGNRIMLAFANKGRSGFNAALEEALSDAWWTGFNDGWSAALDTENEA